MRTIADPALGSIVGLTVLAAMFVVIWFAGDSSAGANATEAEAEAPVLRSARTHRETVTRTAITPEQLRALQGRQHQPQNTDSRRSRQE